MKFGLEARPTFRSGIVVDDSLAGNAVPAIEAISRVNIVRRKQLLHNKPPDPCLAIVNAGEKMHQRAGVKLHQDGMPKASIGGLLLGDKQDEKRIASPENVTQASSVASPPMFPLPH